MLHEKVKIVGVYFRGQQAKDIVASFDGSEGPELVFECEPENEYDNFAIKVIYSAVHIGYIERQAAAWISPDILSGEYKFGLAEITGWDTVRGTRQPIISLELEPNE